MLEIGWSEMAVVALVALIVIGPKDLPLVARTIGQWMGRARSLAREFQSSLEDMAREAELDKVRDEINKVSPNAVKKRLRQEIEPASDRSRPKPAADEAKPAPVAAPATNGSSHADDHTNRAAGAGAPAPGEAGPPKPSGPAANGAAPRGDDSPPAN